MRLDGKVAIITGGSRGQGEAHARLFVKEGAKVVIGDVLDDAGEALAKELGNAAIYRPLDVSDEAQWAAAVDEAVRTFGKLNVLVNNAAIHHIVPIEEETREFFEHILAVNLIGPFLGMQAVLAPMRAAGGGSIVNISSTAGIRGYYGHGTYGATKWGLRGLSKVAGVEFGPSGIRVNSVHPGPIRTDMMPQTPDNLARFKLIPVGRHGEPEEVSQLVCFLASDESSYINATEHIIDGGSSA